MSSEKMPFQVEGYTSVEDFEAVVAYMRTVFPIAAICRWLCVNRPPPDAMLETREFSLQAHGRDFVYTKRYISGRSARELLDSMKTHKLFRVDIGAVYNVPPSQSKLYQEYSPVYKELVFDIDIDRYDGTRQCCTGKMSCTRCWCLVTTAVRALNHLLIHVFGYHDILWVYSGSKGFHCWVSDDAARYLTETQRRHLCEYLWLGSSEMPDVDQNSVFGWFVDEILAPFFFGRYADDHPICATNAIISALSTANPADYGRFMPVDKADPRAAGVATQLLKQARDWYYSRCVCSERRAITEAIMRTVWPRVDTGVTTSLKHTLKAPFCVHPRTQRLCLPVDPATVDAFDPSKVPRWLRHGCTDVAAFDAAVSRFMEYTNTL